MITTECFMSSRAQLFRKEHYIPNRDRFTHNEIINIDYILIG
jgi:hypothetical protein